ncbi:cytochrome P450 [Aspergillus steynii IBT 23096]|uniref:Cytochrome P450 n=1 Tax=Aspergillus steynii IBT 23096 TaxID=1392250 RepID=A0A2I2FU54_9EURO|nr:cytochrome P450 [Aspergillus steynii IBT 23096]PLB44180.1 cytochrome P450 [Aspergillus steynii IBT 23096]
MHGLLPGFAAFTTKYMPVNKTFNSFVLKELTSAIEKSAGILSSEAHNHLQQIWTHNTEWHEVLLKDTILTLHSGMSSRILVGKDLSHDQSWTELVKRNAVNSFQAGDTMYNWPKIFRYLVHWFLAPCRTLRRDMREVQQRVNVVIQQRRESQAAQKLQGKSSEYFDSIQWMEEAAGGHDYDPALVQLTLSMVSEHTMTDLLTQTMLNLTKHPNLVQDLRKEIIAAMKDEQWGRRSLRKLILMDSMFKETQRLKPISRGTMRRKALTNVRLSDGLEVPKGTTFFVSSEHMQSNSTYPHAHTFDGYRFYNLRQEPGHENLHQIVNTSADEVGFGHGGYACPGRYFADAVEKISLFHILLKYDFRLAEGSSADPINYGTSLISDPTAKLVVKRRQEEITL